MEEQRESLETTDLSHALHERRSLAARLAVEGEPAIGFPEQPTDLGDLGQQRGDLEQPVGMELHHDIATGDDLAGADRRDPVMRQAAAHHGEVPRLEGTDVVANQDDPRGVTNEMDLDLGMHVPDVPFPGIIVAAPEEGFAIGRDHALEHRSIGRAQARSGALSRHGAKRRHDPLLAEDAGGFTLLPWPRR